MLEVNKGVGSRRLLGFGLNNRVHANVIFVFLTSIGKGQEEIGF